MKKFKNLMHLYESDKSWVIVVATLGIILFSWGLFFGICCLWGWLFMVVWNNFVPLLWATAPRVGFWLATGIVLIVRILFKSTTTINHK